jgi:hypothetical protein
LHITIVQHILKADFKVAVIRACYPRPDIVVDTLAERAEERG